MCLQSTGEDNKIWNKISLLFCWLIVHNIVLAESYVKNLIFFLSNIASYQQFFKSLAILSCCELEPSQCFGSALSPIQKAENHFLGLNLDLDNLK